MSNSFLTESQALTKIGLSGGGSSFVTKYWLENTSQFSFEPLEKYQSDDFIIDDDIIANKWWFIKDFTDIENLGYELNLVCNQNNTTSTTAFFILNQPLSKTHIEKYKQFYMNIIVSETTGSNGETQDNGQILYQGFISLYLNTTITNNHQLNTLLIRKEIPPGMYKIDLTLVNGQILTINLNLKPSTSTS